MKKNNNFIYPYLVTVFIISSIALISFFTYSYILGYYFTTADSLTLIETSRIQSVNDLFRIFTEPLMSKTKFVELAKHYRPVQTLSFSLDCFIWKLNPFGYHLTDLIVHTLVSILVFFLILFLTNGKRLQAWLAAVIFTTHPILIEAVPGIARRQEPIATLFIILSFLFFLKYLHSVSDKKLLLFFSLFSYTFALGTKEIAIILPLLIFAYLMIFSINTSLKVGLVRAIKKCLPYILLTFIYFLWRVYILKGIGGRFGLSGKPFELSDIFFSVFKVTAQYIADLLYPVDFLILNLLSNRFLSLFVIFLIFIFLLSYRKTIIGTTHNTKRITKYFKTLLAILIILSLAGILASLLISTHINQLLSKTAFGEKLKLLTNLMEKRYYTLSMEFYKEDFILRLLFFALFSISTIWLLIIHQIDKIRSFFINSAYGRLTGFLLIWLFLPLIIYLPTLVFSHHFMYISIIPFSALGVIAVVDNFQFIFQKVKKKEFINTSKMLSFIIIAGLLISIFTYSPLVKKYRDWETASNLYEMFFHKLSEIVPQLPNNATIYVHNLPQIIISTNAMVPRAQTATYLTDYSIKSWLNLNYPGNNIEIISINREGIYTGIAEFKIEMEENNRVVDINVFGEKIR
jgi:hypothetical protein